MRKLFYSILLFFSTISAIESHEDQKPPKIGNFTLRSSQQPGPLIGEGGNINEKGQKQFFLFADLLRGNDNYKSDILPGFLYAIRDDFSIFLNVPFSPGNKDHQDRSSGLEDIFLQFEYAYFVKQTKTYADQATIFWNMTLPTGSTHQVPLTGFGSPTFFLGTTYNRTELYWFYFGMLGGLFTTPYHGTKLGNQFLYQCGVGKTFWAHHGWILAWMVEFDGLYAQRNRLKGRIDRNSGGNLILITPSLWISNNNLIVQIGIGPAFTHYNGKQSKQYYSAATILGWTF